METLNLNTLASSLPTNQQKAEQELLNNFKAAALSITTLYRSSRQNAKRAYNAGYASACQDLLTMIQQGVSVGGLSTSTAVPSHDADNDGMDIGRVMDWIEARLEAIKAQEEEEDEEEEREKERERSRATPAVPLTQANGKSSVRAAPIPSHHNPLPSLPTPNSPALATTAQLPAEPITPSPPFLPVNAVRQTQRSRPRTSAKGEPSNPPVVPPTSIFSCVPDTITPINPSIFPEISTIPAAGTKRRHAVMMLDGSPAPTSTGSPPAFQTPPSMTTSPALQPGLSGPARRRTKSTRGSQQLQNQNINIIQPSAEAMDVEDEGRERKRVARR